MPPMNPEDEEHYHANMMGLDGTPDLTGIPGGPTDDHAMHDGDYHKKIMKALETNFGSWDKNQDGSLSKEELRNRLKKVRDINIQLEWKHSSLEADELHSHHGKDITESDLVEMYNHYHKMQHLGPGAQPGDDPESEPPLPTDEKLDYNHIAFRFWTFEMLPDESFVKKFFKMGDLNEDGVLSKDELPYLMNPYLEKTRKTWMLLEAEGDFQREDTDKDGLITKEEMVAQYKEHGVEDPEKMAQEMIEGLDTDSDGKLSFKEKTAHHHHEDLTQGLPGGNTMHPPGEEGEDHHYDAAAALTHDTEAPGGPEDHDWEAEQLEHEVEMLFEQDADKDGGLSLEELKDKIFELGWEGSLIPHSEL